MNKIIGFVWAALVDFRWFFGAFVAGVLLTFACSGVKAQTPGEGTIGGKDIEKHDQAHNHKVYGSLMGDDMVIVLQEGSFTCKPKEHRAVLQKKDETLFIGCALITKTKILIKWENGITMSFDVDVSNQHDTPSEAPALPDQGSIL